MQPNNGCLIPLIVISGSSSAHCGTVDSGTVCLVGNDHLTPITIESLNTDVFFSFDIPVVHKIASHDPTVRAEAGREEAPRLYQVKIKLPILYTRADDDLTARRCQLHRIVQLPGQRLQLLFDVLGSSAGAAGDR